MIHSPLSKIIRTTPSHLKKLEKMGIKTAYDLIHYFPRNIESTHIKTRFNEIVLGEKNTLSGTLYGIKKEKTRFGKMLTKAQLHLADKSKVDIIWFQTPYNLKSITTPIAIFCIGKVSRNYGKIQCTNPEVHFENNVHIGGIRPVYPESPPITSKWLREKIAPLLTLVTEVPEILPPFIIENEKLFSKIKALKKIHFPENKEEWIEAKKRLGFEEIFEIQLKVIQAKKQRELLHENFYKIQFLPEKLKEDFKKIPFSLTNAQKRSLKDILQDFEKDRPMHRLLQGDVGSGKTIVCFLSALQVAQKGFQVAILAPTEILAKQHYESALKFFTQFEAFTSQANTLFPEDQGLHSEKIALLTGSTSEKNKKQIKQDLKTGKIKIIIGTHAILTEDTIFNKLGLAIIDEQHRFGVKQRTILSQNHTHTLSMTATPIPRSLALTIYGDQDISIIDEKPAGRKAIITRIIDNPKTKDLCIKFMEDQIIKGRQIFWVCPLVDESDKIEAKSVKEEFLNIQQNLFPKKRIGLLHGKMKPKEKEEIMHQFKTHQFDILVSTSVIEVGVDIPNATVMVIENSERFGLAQLHQFRGRIGRNDYQSYCFLMIGKTEDKNRERLKAMEKSNDGFYLSEVDLRLRGSGEIYGLKQSGIPDLKCADLNDLVLLKKARDYAQTVLTEDFNCTKYPLLQKHLQEQEVYF